MTAFFIYSQSSTFHSLIVMKKLLLGLIIALTLSVSSAFAQISDYSDLNKYPRTQLLYMDNAAEAERAAIGVLGIEIIS